jgi:hypothetical protein
VCEPRHAYPIPFGQTVAPGAEEIDDPDDLVTGDNPRVCRCEVTFGEVEVGTAHPARRHPEANLTRSRGGDLSLDQHQRVAVDRSGPFYDPRLHGR